MRGMGRDLYLHVGASKSGTSSLQVGLRASRDALAEHGLGLVHSTRSERATKLLRPLVHHAHERAFAARDVLRQCAGAVVG